MTSTLTLCENVFRRGAMTYKLKAEEKKRSAAVRMNMQPLKMNVNDVTLPPRDWTASVVPDSLLKGIMVKMVTSPTSTIRIAAMTVNVAEPKNSGFLVFAMVTARTSGLRRIFHQRSPAVLADYISPKNAINKYKKNKSLKCIKRKNKKS